MAGNEQQLNTHSAYTHTHTHTHIYIMKMAWLQAKRGREEEFQTALQKLRGKEADIYQEATEIKVLI